MSRLCRRVPSASLNGQSSGSVSGPVRRESSLRQLVAALVVALAALSGFVRPLAPPAPAAAATGEPKVVIIVGATHGATESYRQKADVEYNHVLQYTSNVVRIYSPNATWSVVKAAIEGASIVIYHGHGNGWPSPYTYDPNYTTKNGFGLNSTAGQGDNNNKYYGEPSIETLNPAPNAIVLLHNLCYAAGNSEPGHADPSESVARQRADNYASAFLRAGFGAVIAGGHENAVPYLDALFTSDQTLDEMWRNSWTANGNTFTFASGRTPGATVAMDPESPGKYYRAFTTTDLSLRTGDVTGGWAPPPPLEFDPSAYVPVQPARVLDTRVATGLSGSFATGTPRAFKVAGVGDVPADAVAVTGNVTVVGQTSSGYVSLGPVKVSVPTTSTLNFPRADVRANGVTVPLGPDGKLAATFMGAAGSRTHLVFDVTGYFLGDPTAGAAYVPIAPERFLDTRSGTGLTDSFRTGVSRAFQVAGLGSVPSDAVAITANLTVVGQTSAGYVSLGPVRNDAPTTSTLNFPSGDVRANGVTVPLSATGSLAATFMGSPGARTHLVLDVTGYFLTDPSAGAPYTPIAPARALDTRYGTGLSGSFATGSPRSFQVAGVGAVPANAIAVTGNLTVVGQTTAGYVSLGPVKVEAPTTSTINFPKGDVRANGVTVPLSDNGRLAATFIGGSGAKTHLVFDVTGYFLAP